MASVIFVHGTGGRKEAYAMTLQQIQAELGKHCPNVELVPCLWGDDWGAKLNAGGVSIPEYQNSQGGKQSTPEETAIQLWASLYEDPLYEIRLLGLRPLQDETDVILPGSQSPRQTLEARVEALPTSANLRAELERLEIAAVLDDACTVVVGPQSKSFERLLDTAPSNLDDDYAAIARAIVAQSRLLCKERGIYPYLLINPRLRDEAVEAIRLELSQGEISMGGPLRWIKDQVMDTVMSVGTNAVRRRRGAISDATYPFAGDILVYQAQGDRIRAFIRSQIESEKVKPPVYLLAHSLGGIACVDLLIEQDLSQKVQGLITVGSQAPFFYEIGALQTLPFGQPLPEHFPKQWLNIYDPRDFLSYVGDQVGLFSGAVKDVAVDNQQPFPEAHSAYWATEETWKAIAEVLG